MEAEQVTEKILADAKAEAENIKKQADEKEAAEQEKFNEQLVEHKKKTSALAEKLGREKKLHLLAAARMDIAKEHLAEKSKILDEVFEQARQQLLKLSDDQYKTLCSNLMLEAVETGDEEVIIDTSETRIDEKFVRQINHKLGPESKGNLKLSNQRQPIGAGFILKRGKIKNNVSLDVLLARARKDLEIDLAKDLFS
ncbi:MAG: V-type ATP synthase subunit E [Planctomycetota bacterium]|jgi:V/A-type H+-transporting ATPase subunit E